MSDIDGVFRADHQRKSEQRIIQRKGRSAGTRVVQVERVTSGVAATPQKRDVSVRAAAWEDGFPAKAAPAGGPALPPATPAAPKPTAHVMPMWQPAPVEPQPAAPAEDERVQRPARRGGVVPARRVADPFDPADDGANCLRCGYAVEPARERRGLATCAACD